MNKIWPYIAVFLLGALLVALYAMNKLNPNIITDNYIETVEQNIKKLKQSGANNDLDVIPTINIMPKEKRKFLSKVFKRKKEKS